MKPEKRYYQVLQFGNIHGFGFEFDYRVVNNTYLFRAISERNMAHRNIIDLILQIQKVEPGSFSEVYEVPARTKATRVTRKE